MWNYSALQTVISFSAWDKSHDLSHSLKNLRRNVDHLGTLLEYEKGHGAYEIQHQGKKADCVWKSLIKSSLLHSLSQNLNTPYQFWVSETVKKLEQNFQAMIINGL